MGKIEINSDDLRNHLRKSKMTLVTLSKDMGRSTGFMSNAIRTGYMSETAYDVLCKTLGVEHGAFVASDPAPDAPTQGVYRLNLVYSDSKVLVQLMRGDEVVSGAWAFVKEQSLLGFVYKFAEQSNLNKEESA